MDSKKIKQTIEDQAKALKEKGLNASEIEESLTNLKALYDDALNSEEKAVDAEITSKIAGLKDEMMSEIKGLLTQEKETEKANTEKKAKVFGFGKNKTLNELEKDEITLEFFKNLFKFATTKDPAHLQIVKALSEGSDENGGHLVPEYFASQLIEDLRTAAVMRRAGATVFPMAGLTLELPKLAARPETSWGSENATIATTSADFGNLVLTAHKLVSRIYTSTELAEDSSPAVVELLRRLFLTAIAEAEDQAFFRGSGTGRPKGIAAETIGSIAAGNAVSWDHIIELLYSKLPEGYRNNSAFIMNSRTWAHLLTLKPTNGQYFYGAPGNVLTLGAQPLILGRPVYVQNDLASSEIYVGDWSHYYIGDRTAVAVTTSTEADDTFRKDQVQIKVRKRVAGTTALTNAFRKITGTGVS